MPVHCMWLDWHGASLLPSRNDVAGVVIWMNPNQPDLKLCNSSFLSGVASANQPKGPFRTKKTLRRSIRSVYYCRSFLLSVVICCLISLQNSGFKVSAVELYCFLSGAALFILSKVPSPDRIIG